MNNTIYLRRRRRVLLEKGIACQPDQLIATLQKNLEGKGFLMSPALLERARTLDDESIANFGRNLMRDVNRLVGAHREYRFMYPDFPEQVMGMTESTLYLNAILHYLTLELPVLEKTPRPALEENTLPKVIDLGTKDDFEKIFTQLVGSKTSLSQVDKEDVLWFVAQYRDDIVRLIPSQVPSKENWALLGSELIQKAPAVWPRLSGQVSNPTDILRLAAALSGGDVSLASPTKFKAFNRWERRMMLGSLEHMANPLEDMLRWEERWKRLGEKLHPGDYQCQYPKMFAAYTALRNGGPKSTYNSKLEKLLEGKNVEGALHLLTERPGDFARRLDHMLRLSSNPEQVLQTFNRVAEKVSTPVLLQVLAHFISRGQPQALRVFFPKGDTAKAYAMESTLPAIAASLSQSAVELCERVLIARFAAQPHLGRCYLDPVFRDYMVPLAQRSAAKSLRTIPRGSRVSLPAAPTLRFFIWWKNGSQRTDIDLSAALFGDDFKHVDDIAYYNLKDFGGCHSGDITDAPQGASEFIDVSIPALVAHKVRYVAMIITSYTEQPFCDLPECFAGWMARQDAASGEVYEPKTVQDVVDVSSDTQFCIPVIFDILEGKAIWTDLALKNDPRSANYVLANKSRVEWMLSAMVSLRKPDLFTLFSLHIKARGTIVDSAEKADTVFSLAGGITPYDIDKIRDEYL
jgi:hypothetical protein